MNPDQIAWPRGLKFALFGYDPSEREWEDKLKRAVFGVENVARVLRYSPCKDRSYKNLWKDLDKHAAFVPLVSLPDEMPPDDELAVKWNSFEDMLFEDEGPTGNRLPLVTDTIYPAECEIVYVFVLEYHDARRFRPIPVVFNPELAIKARSAHLDRVVPDSQRIKRQKNPEPSCYIRRAGSYLRRQIHEYYGLPCAPDRELIVTTCSFSVRTTNSKFWFTFGTQAQLVSDLSSWANEREEQPEFTKVRVPLHGGAAHEVGALPFRWPSRNPTTRRRCVGG